MGWLKRLFSRADKRPPPRPEKTAPRAQPPAAAKPAPPTFFSELALVAPPLLSWVPADEIDDAAAKVLEHFKANRSGLRAFPGMAARIMDLLARPDLDFHKLVQAVGQDIAITAKLLQTANSALVNRGTEVQTVRAAVLKLGLREVGQIAVGLAGRSLFESESRAEYSLFPAVWQRYFHDAMTGAFTSGSLSLSARVGQSDNAFLVGMLHDIGKPIALRSIAALSAQGKIGQRIIEGGVDAVVERVHVEVGTILTADWKLPEYLQSAAACHHDADVTAEPANADLHIVRIVDGVKALRDGAMTEAQRLALRSSAAALRIDQRTLRVCATEYGELAQRVTEVFGVPDPWHKAKPDSAIVA